MADVVTPFSEKIEKITTMKKTSDGKDIAYGTD